jgi:hypothetical protein
MRAPACAIHRDTRLSTPSTAPITISYDISLSQRHEENSAHCHTTISSRPHAPIHIRVPKVLAVITGPPASFSPIADLTRWWPRRCGRGRVRKRPLRASPPASTREPMSQRPAARSPQPCASMPAFDTRQSACYAFSSANCSAPSHQLRSVVHRCLRRMDSPPATERSPSAQRSIVSPFSPFPFGAWPQGIIRHRLLIQRESVSWQLFRLAYWW